MLIRRLWPLVFVGVLACDSSPTSPSDSGPPSPPGINTNSSFEDQVVDLMNQRRSGGANCGSQQFGPTSNLRMDGNLRAAAREHSIDMAQRDYFSHVTPEGKTFQQRIQESGYGGQPVAENIAVGHTTPSSVVSGWMGSTGHCRNIMGANARDVGVGFADNYWTVNFGR